MGEKGEHILCLMANGKEIMRVPESSITFSQEDTNEPQHIFEGFAIEVDIPFPVRDLLKYGIYITNNARKMHGETMTRRIAGRKRVRKPEPRIQFRTKGVKK